MDDKNDREFTDEELQAALERAGNEARRAAFAAGQSIMIAKGSRLILIHPDGAEDTVALIYPEPATEAGK